MSGPGIMTRPVPVASSQPDAPQRTAVRAPNTARRTLASGALLNGHREVLIEHAGEIYSLRHTRNGKLILTK
jgi:hemin uptake protein HemP